MSRIFPTGFVAPCQPTPVPAPPIGAEWLHEIKHDGFRLIVRRDGARVRLFTRNGYDAARYPAIAAAAAALPARSFLIDGEVVVADGRRRLIRPPARSHARGAGIRVGIRPW
jgi:bifunctional non-homologous end joining protein LigD